MTVRRIGDPNRTTINLFIARLKSRCLRDLAEFETWYKEQNRQRPQVFPWDDTKKSLDMRWEMWRKLKYEGDDAA